MSGRFHIAIHIMTLLHAAGDEVISSDFIAESVNINPVLIRKEISSLNKFGLVDSKEGKSGGYMLGKPATEITLADIYEAVQAKSILGKARNTPNPACPIGKQINDHFNFMEHEMIGLITEKLRLQTLAQFNNQFN
ncbi:RrF2 family transcriptional regulator [Mucilaginibacter terrae]|uniref:RrF2 family transcriptional regulator n=1 Tax=Mucilaginibacter terrae TaxID=1955052 RepID=UPI003629C462